MLFNVSLLDVCVSARKENSLSCLQVCYTASEYWMAVNNFEAFLRNLEGLKKPTKILSR
jgi:hypothetical protein